MQVRAKADAPLESNQYTWSGLNGSRAKLLHCT